MKCPLDISGRISCGCTGKSDPSGSRMIWSVSHLEVTAPASCFPVQQCSTAFAAPSPSYAHAAQSHIPTGPEPKLSTQGSTVMQPVFMLWAFGGHLPFHPLQSHQRQIGFAVAQTTTITHSWSKVFSYLDSGTTFLNTQCCFCGSELLVWGSLKHEAGNWKAQRQKRSL